MRHEAEKVTQLSPRWYELDSLLPYSDMIGAVGFALMVGGVLAFSWRAGMLVAGIGLMALSWLMARTQ